MKDFSTKKHDVSRGSSQPLSYPLTDMRYTSSRVKSFVLAMYLAGTFFCPKEKGDSPQSSSELRFPATKSFKNNASLHIDSDLREASLFIETQRRLISLCSFPEKAMEPLACAPARFQALFSIFQKRDNPSRKSLS